MYDYLIVGAGFFGATFARLATNSGKKCLVIDSRSHIGGNAYSESRDGIDVHLYGPHIFHTNDEKIWNFVNLFSEFNNFILSPKVYLHGKMYSLPFNMNTFYEIWGTISPKEAKEMIDSQRFQGTPTNLEEQALSLVGKDIYELLIRDYTKKQWKKNPKDLPSFIIKRLPLRFTYDNNYFNDRFQGIPMQGYDKLFEKMLDGIPVSLNTDFFKTILPPYKKLVYTGKIDEYYQYRFGELEYRTQSFVHTKLDMENFQGCAIVNHPDLAFPWTRIVEHKHFNKTNVPHTIITMEIPEEWSRDKIPYYPINDDRNTKIYNQYRDLADSETNVLFGGRLAEYQYMDMHQVIGSAMKLAKKENL
jgi:UDP-galactopyranose mutase